MLWIFHRYPKGLKIISIFEAIVNSMATMFGMVILDGHDRGISTSARLSLFVLYICTSIVFYIYGGFLTSTLAIPTHSNPFNSPDDLLQTNYR